MQAKPVLGGEASGGEPRRQHADADLASPPVYGTPMDERIECRDCDAVFTFTEDDRASSQTGGLSRQRVASPVASDAKPRGNAVAPNGKPEQQGAISLSHPGFIVVCDERLACARADEEHQRGRGSGVRWSDSRVERRINADRASHEVARTFEEQGYVREHEIRGSSPGRASRHCTGTSRRPLRSGGTRGGSANRLGR
jgi:hypothetical protein